MPVTKVYTFEVDPKFEVLLAPTVPAELIIDEDTVKNNKLPKLDLGTFMNTGSFPNPKKLSNIFGLPLAISSSQATKDKPKFQFKLN